MDAQNITARIVSGTPGWVWLLLLILLLTSAGSGYLLYRSRVDGAASIREARTRSEMVRKQYLALADRYAAKQAQLAARIATSRKRSGEIADKLHRIEEEESHVAPSSGRDDIVARYQALGYAPSSP